MTRCKLHGKPFSVAHKNQLTGLIMNWIWSGVLSGSLSFENLHTAISSCTKSELQIQSFKTNFLTARLVSSEEATLQLSVKSTAKIIMSKLLTIHTKSSGMKGTPKKWCILCHFTPQNLRPFLSFLLLSFFPQKISGYENFVGPIY